MSEPIEPTEPLNKPIEPTEPLNTPKSSIEYDDDFVSELVEKIEKKLQKKTYYGRNQEKANEKSQRKSEFFEAKTQSEMSILQIAGIFVFIASCAIAYFGFRTLKKEADNENKA